MFLTINILQKVGIAEIFAVNIQLSYERDLARIFVVISNTHTNAA